MKHEHARAAVPLDPGHRTALAAASHVVVEVANRCAPCGETLDVARERRVGIRANLREPALLGRRRVEHLQDGARIARDDEPIEPLGARAARARDRERDAGRVARDARHRGRGPDLDTAGEPLGGMNGEPSPLGDIVLAGETVVEEARLKEIPVSDHASHLVVHGMLHLLGFDHESEAEAERMEALETRILTGLGIADPYAANAAEVTP